jgi:hypothetical protein
MSHRNSPNDIPDLDGLSRLVDFVFDKRQGQRGSDKKNRRNRHYERQFIRNTLAHLSQADRAGVGGLGLASPHDRLFGQAAGP